MLSVVKRPASVLVCNGEAVIDVLIKYMKAIQLNILPHFFVLCGVF